MNLKLKIAILLILYFLLKLLYRSLEVEQLFIFIKPVAFFIKISIGSPYEWIAGEGYYFQNLNIIINKSCSGFNFFLIALLSFLYQAMQSISAKSIFIALVAAYFLTILANISRTLSLIAIQVKMGFDSPIVHEGVGAFVFISFLLIGYISLTNIFKNEEHK